MSITTTVVPDSFGDFSDAPTGDLSLAEVFNTPEAPAPTTAAPVTPQAEAASSQPTPAAPSAPSFEIKTSTGTVYKSVEDTIKGIEHKDTTINELRQRLILQTGVDPLTNQPVRAVAPEPGQPVPANYAENRKQYMRDLSQAAEKGDEEAYFNAQAKLVFDLLQPMAPVIQDFAKSKAVETVATKHQDFRNFRSSPEFNSTLDKFPVLKQAIEGSEGDFRFHTQLPELYELAYQVYQNGRMPDLVEQAKKQALQTSAQTARPTAAASTMAPPSAPSRSSLNPVEARKEWLRQMEQAGILDVPLPERRKF